MKWYEAEISDMKVSVCCNGLDNLINKTGYEFIETEIWEDSDVLVLFSSKYDKAVKKFADTLKEKGSTAILNMAVFAEAPDEENGLLDVTLIAGEKNLSFALSDLLKIIDYYLYITPVDVGYELSRRGTFFYEPGNDVINLSSVKEAAVSRFENSEDALMLLEAGEEIFISDIESLIYELSEATGDMRLTVAPVRTLSGERIRFSIMRK